MNGDARQRRYFMVTDEEGRPLPAVEYWAGYLDADQPVHEVMPLRRFLKLLWTGEVLAQKTPGEFVGCDSGRHYLIADDGLTR